MSLSSSRSVANAKLLAQKRRQQNNLSAKSMSDKFTQKQSRFELRNEEAQAKQFVLPSLTHHNEFIMNQNSQNTMSGYGASKEEESKNVEFMQGTRSPFTSHSSQSRLGKRLGASTVNTPVLGLNELFKSNNNNINSSSNRYAYNTNNNNNVNINKSKDVMQNVHVKAGVSHSRSARRIAKYQLHEDESSNNNMDNNNDINDNKDNYKEGRGEFVNDLGKRPRAAVNVHEYIEHNHVNDDNNNNDYDDDDTGVNGEPSRKLSKVEKFQQVMSNSKYHRAEKQRVRGEVDATTAELDKEITSLMHLLPKRNKEEEERAIFMQSGSPEVRALLAQYKQNHKAKQLKISSSGAVSITPLTSDHTTSIKESTLYKTLTRSSKTPHNDNNKATEDHKTVSIAENHSNSKATNITTTTILTYTDSSNNNKNKEAPLETNINHNAGSSSSKEVKDSNDHDDFDMLLYSMYSDNRRAHATERTLDEEELHLQEAIQERIAADRSVMPSNALHTLEKQNALQLTRQEWIAQGGSALPAVHEWEEEEEQQLLMQSSNAHSNNNNNNTNRETKFNYDNDDNIDIPSSYEGESSEDEHDEETGKDDDNINVEEEEKHERKEVSEECELQQEVRMPEVNSISDNNINNNSNSGTTVTSDVTKCVAGSAVLDRLLSEIEEVAKVINNEAKHSSSNAHLSKLKQHHACAERYQVVLVQLHTYAVQHPKQVALVCKNILIEAEKDFLRGHRNAPELSLLLYCDMMTHVFPLTDYRHPVITPLILFTCSLLMQMKLTTIRNARYYILWVALLVTCLRGSTKNVSIVNTTQEHKQNENEDDNDTSKAAVSPIPMRFTSEVIIALFNLISLQLPHSLLEPARFQQYNVSFPLLERNEIPLLISTKKQTESSEPEVRHRNSIITTTTNPTNSNVEGMCIGLFDNPSATSSENILLSAYYLLHVIADSFRDIAAFEVMLYKPFMKLDGLMSQYFQDRHSDSDNNNNNNDNNDNNNNINCY